MAFQLTPSVKEDKEFLNDISGYLKDRKVEVTEKKTDSFYDKFASIRTSISIIENQLECLRGNSIYESNVSDIDIAVAHLSKAKSLLV
jgi:hypothetical protein